MSESNEKNVEFDDILELVGSYGRFQKRFNILFNLVFLFLICLPILSLFLVMAVPEHWCYVPGRETTNFTLEEWKEMHIPRDESNVFSSCLMYVNESERTNNVTRDQMKCQNGWEYDKTYYQSTIPITRNWVCDNSIYVANAMAFQRIGDVVGNLLFGQIGDIFGRKIVFYLVLVTAILGRILLLFTSDTTVLFMIVCLIGGMSATVAFQPSLIIAMEISRRETHAHVAMLQSVGWTIGFCVLPWFMWVLRGWVPFLIATSVPCCVFFLLDRYMTESPRWLFNKGKTRTCAKELRRIACCNGIDLSETDDLAAMVEKGCRNATKTYGLMSLFSHWRLIKNAVILIFGWSVANLVYNVLLFNIDNMGGNPFLNFFWQGLAELPAYLIGQFSCDRLGRKWTSVVGFSGTFLTSIAIIFTINSVDYQMIALIFIIIMKFFISISFFSVNLHTLELFPTVIRQTGISTGALTANTIGILSPYIVHLGQILHVSIPYAISGLICLMYAISVIFLPETLNEKLPEVLADSYVFGKEQSYWHFPWRKMHTKVNDRETD